MTSMVKGYVIRYVIPALAALGFLLSGGAPGAFAQGCSVSGISLTATGNVSSSCFVPKGQSIAFAVTGTWAGTVSIDYTENNAVSWISYTTMTVNTASIIRSQPNFLNRLWRVSFDSRTSGTVTGSLLGLNPLPGRRIVESVPIGNVAYSSLGTSTVTVAGTLYCSDIVVPRAITVTDVYVLAGTLTPTDNWMVMLYDGSGNLLGNSATAGFATSGSNTFQDGLLLNQVYIPAAPAGSQSLVFACVQSNGTTDAVRLLAASTFVTPETTDFTGVFGTVPTTMTVPTTFSSLKGPVFYLKGY